MSVKDLAVRAEEMADTGIPAKGVNKAIKALPKQEQNKFRGALMAAAGLGLLISGIRMLKNRSVNHDQSPGTNF